MASSRTIHADGLNWPLDLYIDALRFVRVDAGADLDIGGDPELICITGALSGDIRLQPKRFASAVDWSDTIAFRFLDHVPVAGPCHLCGTSSDLDDYCDTCWEDGERE